MAAGPLRSCLQLAGAGNDAGCRPSLSVMDRAALATPVAVSRLLMACWYFCDIRSPAGNIQQPETAINRKHGHGLRACKRAAFGCMHVHHLPRACSWLAPFVGRGSWLTISRACALSSSMHLWVLRCQRLRSCQGLPPLCVGASDLGAAGCLRTCSARESKPTGSEPPHACG